MYDTEYDAGPAIRKIMNYEGFLGSHCKPAEPRTKVRKRSRVHERVQTPSVIEDIDQVLQAESFAHDVRVSHANDWLAVTQYGIVDHLQKALLDVWKEQQQGVVQAGLDHLWIPVVPADQIDIFDVINHERDQGYSPGSELLKMVDTGVIKHLNEMEIEDKSETLEKFSVAESYAEKASLFSETLERVISDVAFLQFTNVIERSTITSERAFGVRFCNAFLDAFPIDPKDIVKFQNRLRLELIDFLRNGGDFSGIWGKLIVQYGEINVRFSEERPADFEGEWEQAEVVAG